MFLRRGLVETGSFKVRRRALRPDSVWGPFRRSVGESTVFSRRRPSWKRTHFQVSHALCLCARHWGAIWAGAVLTWHPCDGHRLREGWGMCGGGHARVGLSERAQVRRCTCVIVFFDSRKAEWCLAVLFSFAIAEVIATLGRQRLNGRPDLLHLHSASVCSVGARSSVESWRAAASVIPQRPPQPLSCFSLRPKAWYRVECAWHLAFPRCGWKSSWGSGYLPSWVSF